MVLIVLFLVAGIGLALGFLGLSYYLVSIVLQGARDGLQNDLETVVVSSVGETKHGSRAGDNSGRLQSVVVDEVTNSPASWTIATQDPTGEMSDYARFRVWLKASEDCVAPKSGPGGMVVGVVHPGQGGAIFGQEQFRRNRGHYRARTTTEPRYDTPVECPLSCTSSDLESRSVPRSARAHEDGAEACDLVVQGLWSPAVKPPAVPSIPSRSEGAACNQARDTVIHVVDDSMPAEEALDPAPWQCHELDECSAFFASRAASPTMLMRSTQRTVPDFPEMMEHKPSVGLILTEHASFLL